jgi:hypothetical protein
VGEGHGLRTYFEREQPDLVERVDDARVLLAGVDADESDLCMALQRCSGLVLSQLRQLYGSQLQSPLVGAILDGDPHKDVIRTRHSPDGPEVLELLSGR